MSDIAIRVENLGKRYLALRDLLTSAIHAPFRFLSNGARLHERPARPDRRVGRN